MTAGFSQAVMYKMLHIHLLTVLSEQQYLKQYLRDTRNFLQLLLQAAEMVIFQSLVIPAELVYRCSVSSAIMISE